jgi:hypothetical protein
VVGMTGKRPGATVGGNGGAWLVLARDVSESVRVEGETQIRAGFVLDMGTGLVRGVSVGATQAEAVAQALTMGLTKPAGSLPPGRPRQVLCTAQLKVQVLEILSSLTPGDPPPQVRVIEPPAEAEDIFDSFIGHMSGRPQPTEAPRPSDWALLYRHALDFYLAAPWTRWHDGVVLVLDMNIDGARRRYGAVVMGNAGIQHGLVLYPGGEVPVGLDDWEPGRSLPTPAGTVALMLDPPSELPADLRDKAFRYGWPVGAELLPVALRLGAEGEGGDAGEAETRLLAVALAAVAAHDARGPVPFGTDKHATTGEVVLGSGRTAIFSIAQEPPAAGPDVARLRVHQAGFDVVPDGTPVVLGHLPWASVAALRAAARIRRPFPPYAPRPSGAEVPLVAILPEPAKGAPTAAKVAELDPYGVAAAPTDDGQEVLVLVGGDGAQLLMELPAANPSLADFRRRLRATKGLHVVMVADEAPGRGEGTVYGFFECHQPPPKAPPRPSSPGGGKRSKRRR